MRNGEGYSKKIEKALLTLNRLEAERLLLDSADERSLVVRIEQDVVPAMERIGEAWEEGRLALSQVYMSGRICEDIVKKLFPFKSAEAKPGRRAALVVLEDRHLLGKRMVAAALAVSGSSVLDYGSMSADSLVRKTLEGDVDILFISTLMLHSAFRVAKVRENLDRSGRSVKIVVGGAPFRLDRELWREVGADAMGANASEAVSILETLTRGGERNEDR